MEEWKFYNASAWQSAVGEGPFEPDVDYSESGSHGYSFTVADLTWSDYEEPLHAGVNYAGPTYYSIVLKDRFEIRLSQKVAMNLEDDERERYGLRFVGYEDNEYELIEYDVTSNRTTKYKVIKEKTVPGYHPIL